MKNGTWIHSQAQRVSLAQGTIKKCDQNSVIKKHDWKNTIQKYNSKVQFESAINRHTSQVRLKSMIQKCD